MDQALSDGSSQFDVAVIGGGIVGLATALALTAQSRCLLVVLEAEGSIAVHQSGRNSGVIHSGLYYRPGSLKARLCVDGRKLLTRFCQEHNVAYERCGKLVIAVDEREVGALRELHRRGMANGLHDVRWLDGKELRQFEPHANGVAGLFVPDTGIVDFKSVANAYADVLRDRGHVIRTASRVRRIERSGNGLLVETARGVLRCRQLINCAGLQSDRVARMCGLDPEVRIIPFRGEYYELAGERRGLVRNMIYPVPDPDLPFLGVHFTRMLCGRVIVGPNAVLAFKREGYRRRDFSLKDMLDCLSYPGFRRLIRQRWRMGLAETWRSLSKRTYARAARRLVPEVRSHDLIRCDAGVRAQAVEPDGRLVDDFRIVQAERMIHVLNAPSPAATSSLAIGRYIAKLAQKQFGLEKQA